MLSPLDAAIRRALAQASQGGITHSAVNEQTKQFADSLAHPINATMQRLSDGPGAREAAPAQTARAATAPALSSDLTTMARMNPGSGAGDRPAQTSGASASGTNYDQVRGIVRQPSRKGPSR